MLTSSKGGASVRLPALLSTWRPLRGEQDAAALPARAHDPPTPWL
jgi:hypothetical protein